MYSSSCVYYESFQIFFWLFLFVFFLTVEAAVNLFLLICQAEYMRKLLLDRCDAARIFAENHIGDFLGQAEAFFLRNFAVLYNIDSDAVVDVA